VGAQHAVCLVDCYADMFAANRDSSSIDVTVQLIDELLQQRIRTTVTMKTGKRDGVGLILHLVSYQPQMELVDRVVKMEPDRIESNENATADNKDEHKGNT
jgi:hypothetical protein